MGLAQYSNKVEVKDFFSVKLNNNSALKCYGDADNVDYSGFDSSLNKYLNENAIQEMLKVNTEIRRIFNKFKISIKVNMKILNNLVKNHLPHTRNIALGIASNLPQEYKTLVNKKALAKATGLHDIAKVIMPENIINKAGSLTKSEREIMEEHAVLSYEMLKTTDLDKETLNLIKNHHQDPQKSVHHNSDSIEDINLQILSIADIYSALREKRCYKEEMNKEQALKIIYKEVECGKFHPCIYQALVAYTEKQEDSHQSNLKRKVIDLESVNSLRS